MSQQTQVNRVAGYYRRWLKKFPSFSSLAKAPAADVLREWSGLGYNSRALRFHSLAKIVSQEFRSRLPQDPEALRMLPGIGRYTAHAVACFAFEQNVPVVDVNIRRILTRWTKKVQRSSEQMNDERAWITAQKFLPKVDVFTWNQALMDLGGLVCTARSPKCGECPVSAECRSAFSKAFLVKEDREKKNEPSWRGIPRRLYRGKILKMLHHHAFTAEETAAQLWEGCTRSDIRWTTELLEKMRTDGLLSHRSGKYSIAS
jgi:A/G-specific adenine glycosylase